MKTVYAAKVCGTVTAPSSKSLMQRAIAAGLLADGCTAIYNPSFCEDSIAAIKVAEGLGAKITINSDSVVIYGGLKQNVDLLDCGESGLCVRSFSPIAALLDQPITLTGTGSLLSRPVSMIEVALNQLGVKCQSDKGFLPLTICGKLLGGQATIDASVSSQLLTGLLFALPLAENNSEITVKNLKSRPYIDLTIQLLQDFGVKVKNYNYELFQIEGRQKYFPRVYNIEGDWSGSAFLLVAGAIAGEVTVMNLNCYSSQADQNILEVLTAVGAETRIIDQQITVKQKNLFAFDFDATDCPDLFPPLAALAACCNGISKIRGVSRLQHKESNRGLVIKKEFAKLGITVNINSDEMQITGGEINGGIIDSHNDHRIAMATAILGLKSKQPVQINGWQSVNKSYPDFFEDLGKLISK